MSNHDRVLVRLGKCGLTLLNSLLQSCPTLWDPVDYSPPGSSVHGILQARILEWGAIPSSRGSSRPRDRTRVSCGSCIGRRILHHWATWEAQFMLKYDIHILFFMQLYNSKCEACNIIFKYMGKIFNKYALQVRKIGNKRFSLIRN